MRQISGLNLVWFGLEITQTAIWIMEGQMERHPYIRVTTREPLVTTSGHGDLILGRPAKVDSISIEW